MIQKKKVGQFKMFLNGAGSEFRIERRVYSEARNCRPQWRRKKEMHFDLF